MIEVALAQEEDAAQWNSYLERAQVNNHAYAWSWHAIIADSFGHEPYYFIARRSDADRRIVGVLPLFLVNSILFGKALISVPYLNAGGIIADTKEAFLALRDRANTLGGELGVDYLELRQRAPISWDNHGLEEREHKVSMLLPLNGTNAEEVFSSFPPKLRSQIRRPTKNGIYAQVSGASNGLSEEQTLNSFYAVFAEHMRDLGTPVYPRKFFFLIKRHFGDACRIVTVWYERKVAAVGITIGFSGHTEILCASSLRKYNKYSPNMLLYWEAIKTACADGYVAFDFGRSSYESNTYRFKEQWGPTPLPLHWYYQVFAGKIPDVNPKSAKFSFLVECWKHLPLAVANHLGPFVTKGLP